MSDLDAARRALQERQGLGARYDAPEAPAADLRLARLGTAYFARKLGELGDAALYAPSRVSGWTRAHVICDVAYQARAISRQVEAATAGEPVPPFYDGEAGRIGDIELGATLPARALRHLFDHAAVHLNVVWRDLPGSGWDVSAADAGGALRPLRATAMERARRLWRGALELDNGTRLRDLPPEFRG
ncbi:maleylpyruvate isomerase N-terminal domain-containing protein [Labrys neptuniae]|uniref:maleylpyruvate isomerase N-terminal domain-containing protein n=1 Tax=Labrys neptuniae TaxID=376174 RepID=UPI00288C822E|nr:maleylpyruvate isomerase N-terminal domain-containing protein [Labrys neptuniae]MDT3382351.1 maleylpyruvate isomerase N-terminal domain-containing protein [Labrys neptuniae]